MISDPIERLLSISYFSLIWSQKSLLKLCTGSVRRNHYFGLGSITKPKPKLAILFRRYRNQYRNHISKGESSY